MGTGMNEQKLEQLVISVDEVIRNGEKIYAHRPKDEKAEKKELLREHVERSFLYFKQLYKEKSWEDIFRTFQNELLPEFSEEGISFFYELLVNTVIFHDMGKINPEFQRIKMENKELKQGRCACLDSSNHSLLSAAIYIDYFMKKLMEKKLTESEERSLQVILMANAYIISRHHGSLTEFETFSMFFFEKEPLYEIFYSMKEGEFADLYKGPFYDGKPGLTNLTRRNKNNRKAFYERQSSEITLYTYVRFLFSILVSCDYYATTEYENHVIIKDFGGMKDIAGLNEKYEQSERLKTIREFNPDNYEDDGKEINILRTCMFYEAERNLMKHKNANIYFLEAPTGGGKSNIAMNLSFKLLNEKVKKIFYVYPFNTLVEQNVESLEKVFGNTDFMQDITVVNSITPIKTKCAENQKFLEDENKEENANFYQQALLDRQFMNYPFVLTTHVNLFQIMFGNERETAISFYQLSGSVVVLDEIQSYKNLIWTEIMLFLEQYSKLLNIKVIIMSATLPKLDYLTGETGNVVYLIENRARYFEDKRFKGRVKISYELLDEKTKTDIDVLYAHILSHVGPGKKILVEFIKKRQAEQFYWKMKQEENDIFTVLCMTGDDNQIDRKRILKQIAGQKKKGIILIATQVIEAGVDIDMDIGYKDISKLDSDEQFLGRINRNFKRDDGITYFFDLDNAQTIYGEDYRMNQQLMLTNVKMQELLQKKDFAAYYGEVLKALQQNRNSCLNEDGIRYFLSEEVGRLDYVKVAERMRLIQENQWDISVFLSRKISCEDGTELDGDAVWYEYKTLLSNQEMNYAEKKYKLSKVRSSMNYFIYQIKKNSDIPYQDRVGELYCISDGEKYFEAGRLNKELLQTNGAMFIE